jgi:hypothetical protein
MSSSSLTEFEYILELFNPKKKLYKTLANWLVFANLTLAGFLMMASIEPVQKRTLLIFAIILPSSRFLLEKFFRQPHQKATSINYYWYFFIVAWVLTSYYWLAIANSVLFLLYWVSTKTLLVKIGPIGIRFPSFPSVFITWSSLTQVILKDGLLTIDKKDNKLTQQLLANSVAINEEEFNAYCQLQLQQALQ